VKKIAMAAPADPAAVRMARAGPTRVNLKVVWGAW
jgi:hypothetical protein